MGSERLSSLPDITQLISGRAGSGASFPFHMKEKNLRLCRQEDSNPSSTTQERSDHGGEKGYFGASNRETGWHSAALTSFYPQITCFILFFNLF